MPLQRLGRETTRREHLLELQRDFGFRSCSATIYRELAGWLLPIALSTDVGPVLVGAVIDELRQRKSWRQPCRRSSAWPALRWPRPAWLSRHHAGVPAVLRAELAQQSATSRRLAKGLKTVTFAPTTLGTADCAVVDGGDKSAPLLVLALHHGDP
jgi:hypothetical protein